MASQIVRQDALRSLAFGSISGTYAALGSVFLHPMRIIRIINTTVGDVIISFDGIVDHLFVPAGSFVLYDFCSDTEPSLPFLVASRTQIYCKQSTAPVSGAVYLEATYGAGE
jgi:hypothetical protein